MSTNSHKNVTSKSCPVLTLSAQEIIIDNPWILWPQKQNPILAKSLRLLGQQEPILVFVREKVFFLVHGYQRVKVLKSLKQSVQTLVIDYPGPKELGLLYFSLNTLPHPKEWAWVKAFRYLKPLGLSKSDLEILGLHPQNPLLAKIEAWLNLSATWDLSLAQEHLNLDAAPLLAKFLPAEREQLFPLFQTLKWSNSNQKKLLTWLLEIRALAAKNFKRILDTILSITQDELSPQDKIKKILGLLWEKRYPVLASKQKQLSNYLTNLSGGTNWEISHPSMLENTCLEFKARANNLSQLKQLHKDLESLIQQNPWHNWEQFLV